MEQRRFTGKSHWYHETQSSTGPQDVLPLVPEAAHVDDRFLLDLVIPEDVLIPFQSGCNRPASWLTNCSLIPFCQTACIPLAPMNA